MISVASLTLKVIVLSTAHRKNDKSESFLLCRNINSNGLQMYSVLQELLECMHLATAACKPVTVLGDLNLNLKNNTVERKHMSPLRYTALLTSQIK